HHMSRLSCDIAAIKGKIHAVTRRRHLIPEALASSARLNLLTGSPRSPCVGLVLRARCDEEDGREQAQNLQIHIMLPSVILGLIDLDCEDGVAQGHHT